MPVVLEVSQRLLLLLPHVAFFAPVAYVDVLQLHAVRFLDHDNRSVTMFIGCTSIRGLQQQTSTPLS
eukprot:3514621-Amphidinium_carterae.1